MPKVAVPKVAADKEAARLYAGRLTTGLRNTALLFSISESVRRRLSGFWGGLVAKVAIHDPRVNITRRFEPPRRLKGLTFATAL